METKKYRNTGIPARQIVQLVDYINAKTSAGTLGQLWGGKVVSYKLHYPHEVIEGEKFERDVLPAIEKHGETIRHETYFESRTGRVLHFDTTDPSHITLAVQNGSYTSKMQKRLEFLMGLTEYARRVFISHGRDPAWHQVQHFIKDECRPALPTLELSYQPGKGRTIIEKLDGESQNCSFAAIVMTGDDLAEDEVRVRENVMHEIGFFQGRYGRSRVCLLHEDDVKIPSNLAGIEYLGFPNGQIEAAFIKLQRELQAAFPDDQS